MAEMLDKALQSTFAATQTPPLQESQAAQQPSENRVTARPVTMDRPMLVSSATSADLRAWEDDWQDFACCQHLSAQDRKTRASTLRQCLDEDLRRFLQEGTIEVPNDPDAQNIISAVKEFVRRQRNPLLDRINFYNRRQQRGELFDSFFTSLKEL